MDAELFENVRTIFWNCPVLFIPEWCTKWHTIYMEYKRYNTPVDFWTLPLKYRKAASYFEARLIEQQKQKADK